MTVQEELVPCVPRGEPPRSAGFRVGAYDAWVMTRDAAHAYADGLVRLMRMTGFGGDERNVLAESGPRGPFRGKFEHSLFVTDGDGRPIAMLGGQEEPANPDWLTPRDTLYVAVLAVDPEVRQQGFARDFCLAAIRRSTALGFVELETDEPFNVTCHVRDEPMSDWLVAFYCALGFVEDESTVMEGVRLRGLHLRPTG